jgi:hypothetical protein
MSGNTMPAGQLHLLLWHYFAPEPYPCPRSRSHEGFIEALITEGLMDYDPERERFGDDRFVLTEKGNAYIQGLLKMPLPVQRWVMEAA